MNGSRSTYTYSLVKVPYAGIQAICLKTQAVGIKALYVLIRKIKQFEQPQNNFFSIAIRIGLIELFRQSCLR